MARRLTPIKAKSIATPSWVRDAERSFRRIGGLSRLDVVCSLLSIVCVAVWNCLREGKQRAVSASVRPAVYLLTYIPTDKPHEPA